MHRKPLPATLQAALLSLTLTAAACGTSTQTTTPDTTPPATTSPVTTSPITTSATGIPEILSWEATLVGGGTINGADLAGQDTLFWFWAPT
ncbi:MAG: hypothetical protein H8E69_00030 [Actinobacteria bacterium]|nr:hypothetical protein [Actinomycetota bacterium]